MTVYSINKQRILDQANMTPASDKAAQPTAEAAFANVLTQIGTQAGLKRPDDLFAPAALKERFDRPVADDKRPEPAQKADRAEGKQSDRATKRQDARQPEKAERVADKPKTDAGQEEAASVETPAEQNGEIRVDETAQKGGDTGQNSQTQAGENAAAQPEATAAAAPVQASQQKQAATGTLAQTLGEAAEADPNQDPFAWLDQQHGDQIASLASEIDAGDMAFDGAADFDLALQTATAAANAQAKAGKAQTDANAAQAAGSQLASQQAEDMAEMLAGTGANLQVKVKVAEGPAQSAMDPAAAAGEAASLMEVLLAQDVSAAPGAQGQSSTQNGSGQNGQAGSGATGTNNAAQQLAANGALNNAMNAAGKAVEAKPFAAALAAQVDGAAAAQAPSGQNQGAQPLAGLNGANGTQAAQKTAQAQAAQAPRQPHHVQQQQVVDQVTVQINKQVKDGGDTIKVQLKPVELGQIEIKLELAQDGRVTGVVTAENKDTLAMLKNDARSLEKALSEAGLKADAGSLSFNLRGDGQQNAERNGSEGRQGRRGRVMTGIDATAEASAANQAGARRSLSGRSGVDIQV